MARKTSDNGWSEGGDGQSELIWEIDEADGAFWDEFWGREEEAEKVIVVKTRRQGKEQLTKVKLKPRGWLRA